MADILIPTVAQGLMWALMALGVYITFRVLDIADLSVEGSFPLGAAVAATALVSGYGVTAAFLLAAVAGALAGIVTGILTTKLKIPPLLAGILTMIGLYSVNLHVMGKANVALLRVDTVFSYAAGMGLTSDMAMMAVGLVGVMLVGVILYWFFGTELGTAIRATGCNSQMARAQGVNTNSMIVLGLLISNALVALSGALVCQCRRRHGYGHDRDWAGLRHYRRSALRHPQFQKLPDFSDPGFDRLPSCDCYCAAAWYAAQRPQALYGHPRCDCAFDAAYSRKVARTQERSLI